jgi:acetyltransferase-like isoleucine patch superfamily enzyme
MKAFFEKLVQFRNPSFRFDGSLTMTEILQFSFAQFMALLRGAKLLFRFRNPKRMMAGRGVRFSFLSRVTWGSYFKPGDFVHIAGAGKKGICIGNNVGIGAFSRLIVATSLNQIGEFIAIGNNVGIGEFAYLGGAGGLSIGDDCIIGQYFSCHPENHFFNDPKELIRKQGVSREGINIGKNCWIGSKVTILDGVRIGDGCVIAAGAVVNQSFPPDSVIGGVPAKFLKHRGKKTLLELMNLEHELLQA